MKKNYEDSEYGSEDGGKYMENKYQVRKNICMIKTI